MKWEDYDNCGNEGILQDKRTGLKFGPLAQLTVMGYYSSINTKKIRYILQCSICKEDPELFGDGLFDMQWGNIKMGNMPCGCSISPKWSEDQMKTRAIRLCREKGYTFIDWKGEYTANTTKILLLDEYGQSDSIGLANLLSGQNSSNNRKRMTSISKSKTDGDIIQSFFNTGVFHEDTKFWKGNEIDYKGQRTIWYMTCPLCGVTAGSYRSNLQKGKRPCGCTKFNGQKFMYINGILDGELYCAIKFGKTHYPTRRLKEQNNKCALDIVGIGVWEFKDPYSSTQAEYYCKTTFECGIISYDIMRDGWSETTYAYNYDKIVKIYEDCGGIKL